MKESQSFIITTNQLASKLDNSDFFELFEAVRCHVSVRATQPICASLIGTSVSTFSRSIMNKKHRIFNFENLDLLINLFAKSRAANKENPVNDVQKTLAEADELCFQQALDKLKPLLIDARQKISERSKQVEISSLVQTSPSETEALVPKESAVVDKYRFSGNAFISQPTSQTFSR